VRYDKELKKRQKERAHDDVCFFFLSSDHSMDKGSEVGRTDIKAGIFKRLRRRMIWMERPTGGQTDGRMDGVGTRERAKLSERAGEMSEREKGRRGSGRIIKKKDRERRTGEGGRREERSGLKCWWNEKSPPQLQQQPRAYSSERERES